MGGEKRIVISDCILEDLIYGKLKGPVISDAPKGMKIVGVYEDMKPHTTEYDGKFNVYVEHEDFDDEHKFRHTEVPILEIKFSIGGDPTTVELVKQLEEIAQNAPINHKEKLKLAAHFLQTHEAEKMHLIDDKMEMYSKIQTLETAIREIMRSLEPFAGM